MATGDGREEVAEKVVPGVGFERQDGVPGTVYVEVRSGVGGGRVVLFEGSPGGAMFSLEPWAARYLAALLEHKGNEAETVAQNSANGVIPEKQIVN